MAGHCVNRSSNEFLELQKESNINPIILASKVSLWQESNTLDKFPTIEELNLNLDKSKNNTENKENNLKLQLENNKTSKLENLINKFYSMQDDNSSISKDLIENFNNRTEDSLDITERKIEELKQSLNIEVIIDTSIQDSGQLLPSNHPLVKKYNKPVIIINPNKLFSDTVIHEFGHLYIDLLGKEDSVLNQAYELLRDTNFYSQIAKQYPELSSEDLDKEVLATAIGIEGDKIFKQDLENLSTWQKIKNYILDKLAKIFNLQPTAIEKLAKELLSNNTRLTGSELYNSLIVQRSKYKIESTSNNKQSDIISLLDNLQSSFTKEKINDENVYRDKEGNIFSNSVTKNIKKYQKKYNSADKGDYELKFDKDLYTKDNILFQLNSPKLPLALTKALNDLINDRITTTTFTKDINDKNWFESYNRELRNNIEEDDLTKDLLEKVNGKPTTFTETVLKHFDVLSERANDYQNKYNQAPIVGDIIHSNIENYIKNNIPFSSNIKDEENLLLNAIKNIIDLGKKKGSIFRTEQIIYSENKQIPGTVDLMEITKSGQVILYDYKTINSFSGNSNNNKYKKSDEALYFNKGYMHQLLSYGAILNQYNITLTDDPYHIIMAEVGYVNTINNEDSLINIKEVRTKSLSDKNLLSLLNITRNEIFNEFATNKELENIKIKPEINDLKDLSNKINNQIRTYRKITKNLDSNLDSSYIEKIHDDLKKEMDLEKSINEYIAKNNEVIIKSYVNNIHTTLGLLESQKEHIGEIVSSKYLQSLNYILQVTDTLKDIKNILSNNSKAEEITVEDKNKLLKTIDETLLAIDKNQKYYIEKTKRAAIVSFTENSNLMQGLYKEKYQLEANKLGYKYQQKTDYIQNKLKENKDYIKIAEINYWTKQYEDGFADLRFLEYLIADPGMNKSQFVQLTKNILDKTDLSVRNKMLDIVPDINKWYQNLSFDKTGDPKKVWNKFIEKNNNNLTGAVIPEFTSKYRDIFMKYEYQIKDQFKVLKKLQTQKTIKSLEQQELVKSKIQELRDERNKELKEKTKSIEDFQDSYINPEFLKLNQKEQEDLRFIHKNLLDADERLYSNPEKKLVKELPDGSYIFNLPRERMSNIESIISGEKLKSFKSKFEDLSRPPADEDELNITQEEYNTESRYGSSNLDIYGNEVFQIPVYYRNELEDDTLQSYDIPTLLTLNHETTVFFEEHKLVEADLFVVAESLNSKNNDKILKSDSFVNKKIQDATGKQFQKSDRNLVYQAVKSSIDNRLYKRSYRGVYSKSNYRLIKSLEAVSKYSSIISLAGNFMSALTTSGQGVIYRALEAKIGEHINEKDWTQGSKKTMLDFPNMLKDTQNFVAESRTELFIKKFGLETTAKSLTNKFVQDNFIKKQLDSGTIFTITSMAEATVTANLMYSLLNKIKALNEQGEYINQKGEKVSENEAMSLDEAYEVVEGKLVLNPNVKYTTLNVTEKYNDGINKDNTIAATEVSRYIRSIYADLYGQYNQDMKSVLQRTIWGKLAMSLRGWLPRAVNRRWRGVTDIVGKDFMSFDELRSEENIDKRFYSQDQKQFQEGHYVTTLRFIRSLYKTFKTNQLGLLSNINNIKSTMTDHEIANLKRTNYEIATIVILSALTLLLRAIAMNSNAPDEDKEKIYFAAYLAYRIKNETSAFLNPGALTDLLTNPAASITMTQRIFDWLNQLARVSFDKGEFNVHFNDVYENGNKKGNYKIIQKSLGLLPGYNKEKQFESILGIKSENPISSSFEYQLNH